MKTFNDCSGLIILLKLLFFNETVHIILPIVVKEQNSKNDVTKNQFKKLNLS